jgi:hypothetical protein
MNLQFLNTTKNYPYNTRNTQSQPNIPNIFQIRRRILQPPQQIQQPQIVQQEEPEKKRMIWGPAIWFLFHTLAEKVKEESFTSIRIELLNNIYSICVNLPCPMCSTHAKEYMDKINFNTIRTKEDLKNMFFQFHNTVNFRKNVALFPKEQLDEKYSKAVTINIIHNFIHHFSDRYRSPKLIANDLMRTRIVIKLKDWFSKNIQHFDA